MIPSRPCAIVALALTLAAATAAAQDSRRLQIEIEFQRDAAVESAAERGRARLTQQLTLSAVLHSDGAPMPSNPLDPEDGARQLARAQRQVQAMQAAQARHGGAVAASATPAAPSDIAALQTRAQALMARCGQDRECLMREASSFAAAQVAGGDASLQARLRGYGQDAAACQGQPAGQREACVAEALRRAGGGGDDGPPDEVVETPYLMYSGRAGCALQSAVRIDGRAEGSFPDVQGEVPFTQTVQAQASSRDDTLCPLLQAVLDTRDGRLWTRVLVVDGAPGIQVRSEKGRAPQRHEGRVALRWHEAEPWLLQRLARLNAGGQDRARLPAAGGQTEVTLRWRFAPA
jgi:hypothetical protein